MNQRKLVQDCVLSITRIEAEVENLRLETERVRRLEGDIEKMRLE